jgi:hypothetical protein
MKRGTYARPKVLRNFTQTDSCVSSNAWLFIVCSLGQELQKLAINDTIRQLGNHYQNCLYCLLSDKRSAISETSGLWIYQQNDRRRPRLNSYHR